MQDKKKKYPMMFIGEKPHVVIVRMPDGQIRLLGATKAARWLGCSQQALGQILRRSPGIERASGLIEKVREHYPEIAAGCDGDRGRMRAEG